MGEVRDGRLRVGRGGGFIAALRDGSWLTPARLRGYALLSLCVSVAVAIGWIAASRDGIDPSGRPIGTDFMNVYAAGVMVLEGRAPLAYDWPAHNQVQQALIPTGDYYGWHYPPVFLALAALLATMPYFVALSLYVAATLALFVAAGRRILSAVDPRLALPAIAGFPAVFVNAGHGQNGFLTAALLAYALVWLEKRPLLSGLMLGVLAYKPQFGLLIPLALLAGGCWRAFAAAAVTVVATNLAALALFGRETFLAFLGSLTLTREIVLEQASTGLEKFQSVFAAVLLLGGGVEAAYAAQAAAILAAMALVAWTWWRSDDAALSAAVLVLAIPLTTPYMMDYDLTILGVAIAFLAARGLRRGGFEPWTVSLMALLWAVPMFARSLAAATHLPVTLPLLLVLLAILARIVARRDPTARAAVRPA